MNIFVSSTGADLKNERKAVRKQVATMGHLPIGMESFGASPNPPLEECFAKLDEADLMILILGPGYGSIHTGTGLSYTENEFRYAQERRTPVLAFPEAGLDRLIRTRNTGEDAEKYQKFVSLVRASVTHPYEPFESPDQLAALVAAGIHNYARAHGELGRKLAPFVAWDEYFGKQLLEGPYLNHAWPLVGRADTIRDLSDFAFSDKTVAVLYGAGGLGKSRLLLEFGRTFDHKESGWDLRFLRESLPWQPDFPRSLPAKPCVIVVDDAHRYADLEALLTLARSDQYADRTKLLLSARPSGKHEIDAALSRSLDASQVGQISPLRQMCREDVLKLAREALGAECVRYDERLVRISDGCPLVAVVAGRLVRDRLVKPELCSTDDQFKRTVLDRFAEELTKALPGDNQRWQDLLALISALGPVRPADPNFREKASVFLKMEIWDLPKRIATLENHGLLLRRGGLVRITPDVLSDHVLSVACVTPPDQETGYAKGIFDQLASIYGANLLRNLSEMQWRIDETTSKPDVLSSIWRVINAEFDGADYAGKVEILRTVEAASPYQPRPAIELVERAISGGTAREVTGDIFKSSRNDVLDALPRVLRQIALHPDYTDRAADLLWELGRQDGRELGRYPDHAIRIAQELASYEYRKPVLYCEKLLKCAKRWLDDPDVPTYRYSPLDVVDQLLEKHVGFQELEGYTVKLAALPLNRGLIQGLRDGAVQCVARSLKHPNSGIVRRALGSLRKMLNPPVSLYGRAISAEERDSWRSEQTLAADLLREFVRTTKSPTLLALTRHDFGWFAQKGSPIEARTKIAQALDDISPSLDLDVAICLTAGHLDFELDDVRQSEERYQGFLKKVAADLFATCGSDAATKIEGLVSDASGSGIKVSGGQFFFALAEESRDHGLSLAEHILGHPGCYLGAFTTQILFVLRSHRPSEALNVMRRMVASASEDIKQSLAHAYAYSRWMSHPSEDDFEMLERLCLTPNANVKYLVIHGLKSLGDAEPESRRAQLQRRGLEVLLKVDLGGDPNLAEALFESIDADYGIPPDLISDKELKELLENLVSIPEIADHSYHLARFLRYVANRDPRLLLQLLMARIARAVQRRPRPGSYLPVPFGFEDLFVGIQGSPAHDDLLATVASDLSGSEGPRRYWLIQLFAVVAAGFGPSAVRLIVKLSEQKERREEAYTTISELLQEAPENFVFANDELCANILERSRAVSITAYNRVMTALLLSAQSGGFSRTPGEPSPLHESIRDRANQMAQKYCGQQLVEEFYRVLAKRAQETISELLGSDEEFLIE